MRRTKKMLALLLAGVLTFSNVAYAAPGDGGSAPMEEPVDNATDISNPKNEDAEALEMGSETDPEDEVKDLETDPEGEVTDPETDPEGEVTDPETDPEGEVTDPETDPEGEVTDPETDPEGEVTDPETDPEGEVTDPETDPEGEVTDPETDPEDEVKDPETDPEDEGKDPEVVDDVDAAGAAEVDPENPDADAEEEVTEGEEESEEAVTYKITFAEEPESHGTLLTIDDEEIGEEGIETDEEGYAQFKVQADEGWTAEAVCGDEVLSLVEDSYYEVQVSEDAEVTVSYQEVAVEEEPLPEVVEEPEAVTEDEELEAPAVMLLANMIDLYANETIKVKIDGVAGVSEDNLEVGTITSKAPHYTNYTYQYATLEKENADEDAPVIEVVAVGVYEIAGERYEYYSADGESAQLIGDNQVVLHYSKNALGITYTVSPDEEAGGITGPDSAQAGTNVSFIVEPALGYKTADVKVNGESKFVAGQEVYTFTMPDNTVNVEVIFDRAESYTVTLSPLGDSANYDQHDYIFADCQTPSEVTVGNGETLTTYIYTDATADGLPLQYIVVNGQRIEINNSDNTSATVDGMNVSIVKKWHEHSWLNWQYFEITISNVQQDISIDYFIKSDRGIEERTIQVDELGEGIELYVKEENSDRLQPVSENDVYTLGWYGSQIYFYAKAKPGYQVASIEGDGVTIFSHISDAVESGYPGSAEALAYGCQWELHFTRSVGDEANRTLSMHAVPIEYTVSYDANGGDSTPTDNNKYSVAEGSNVITLADAPTKAGEKFIGWSLGGKTYDAGDTIIVDTDFLNEADDTNNFTFVAQWKEEAAVADYKVEYYKESAAGSYLEEPDLTKTFKNATVGDTAVANATPSDLDIEGYVLDTNYEEFQATGTVTKESVLVLKVFYAKDTNNNGEPDNKESYSLTINYVFAEGEESEGVTLPQAYTKEGLKVNESYSVESPEVEGYVARPETVEGTIVDRDVTATVSYYKDTNGNGEPDTEESYKLTINYVFAEGEESEGVTLPQAYTKEGLKVNESYSVESPEVEGYVARPETVTGTVVDQDVTKTVSYYKDTNGNGEPDTEESYSLTINYAYAQGEEGSAALPAVNRQNDLAVGHAYSVASPEIEGYVAVPAVVSGTISDRDVSATVLYYIDSNGNDVPDSQEPDDGGNGGGGGSSDEDDDDGGSGGTGGGTTGGGTAADTTTGTGTTPGAGTGAAPAPVTTVTIAADDADAADTADDADAAEGADEDYALEEVGEDTENAAEDEESVATINEDETPLANQQIHSPVCILHWLILLAALIIAVIFIWDGHNRKKRIEELKKELGMK